MSLPWPDLGDALRAAALQRACQPPTVPRLPLCLGSDAGWVAVGSVAPLLWELLAAQGTEPPSLGLRLSDGPSGPCWRLPGDATPALARLGQALRIAGLVPHGHGEPLPVLDAQGRCLGAVERGLTRLLGLPVQCVHLVGVVEAVAEGTNPGRVGDPATWVQQRALDKAQDPGRWDTLVGGTVAHGERPADTLARELWEEAGLHIDQLQQLQDCGMLTVARPASGDSGLTYAIDHIHCYRATLDGRVLPVNQDGEVLQFQRLSAPELTRWLQQDRFTLEAASVLVKTLM